jgi:phosphatidylglycerol:prolipoprotein diacylglycerol transferase
MYPRLFTLPAFTLFGWNIGPLTLHAYGVLLAVAFLAGLWVAARQARRAGLDAARVTDLGVYVLIAGLLGAKGLLLVVDWDYYSKNWHEVLGVFQSGGVFYGGLLLALPVALWLIRRYELPVWATTDVLTPGVVLGQAIGRLGCLAAGCCYGRAADVPWAVTFRDIYAQRTVGTPVDVPLHPTQVYESLGTLLIFVVLLWVAPRKRFHGQVTATYILLYAAARFSIEFFRGDSARGAVFGGALSTSQFIALTLVLVTLLVLPYLWKNHRVAPAPSSAPQAA